MSRITQKQLDALCDTINRETGSPLAYWADGKPSGMSRSKTAVGHYHIDQGFGGSSLVRISNEQGGETTILIRGSTGDLYERMHAFLSGYRAAKGN
jgi:hypothetical protein